MKKLIRWLAKVFKADITVERIIYKEVYKPLEDKLSGSISVDGSIEATKDIVCYKSKTN